nr:hypothetical protein CFP56_56507 [Quercus suber]
MLCYISSASGLAYAGSVAMSRIYITLVSKFVGPNFQRGPDQTAAAAVADVHSREDNVESTTYPSAAMSVAEKFTPPVPVPPPEPAKLAPGLTRVTPLSRRGKGPGLLVLVDEAASGCTVENGIVTPLMKWAEEGYCVVEITREAFESDDSAPLETALHQLGRTEECEPKDVFGLVCYEYSLWEKARRILKASPEIAAAVVYGDASSVAALSHSPIPVLVHLSGTNPGKNVRTDALTVYDYPDQTSPRFATPSTKHFSSSAEGVAHTRNLLFLKRILKGPTFDLEALWDEHTYYEFETRDVEKTMNTMLTGGIGRADLTAFYRDHFIFSNPTDTKMELVSRTVGVDRVVDEFIFKFTHNQTIDWLLPGVPPTRKQVEIPMMAVVNFRGDRLAHEHITWDSASALRQIGVLPEYVPYSGPAVKGTDGNKPQELRIPATGKDTVKKLKDKNSVKSNQMFGWGVKETSMYTY